MKIARLTKDSGVRSSEALRIMRNEKFTDVADLLGGYSSL
jgi:hypothetical protein